MAAHELSTLDRSGLHTGIAFKSDHDISHSPLEATTTSLSRASYSFPEGGIRAWLVVVGSFFTIGATFGLLSSIGVFSAHWQRNELKTYTSRDVGWILAVNVFLNLFLGVQVGPLFDRYGPRWLLGAGSLTYVASIFIMAECTKYWQFMIVYGIIAGASSACLTTTALSVIAHWFEKKRGFASGIALVGSSVGGVTFPLVLRETLEPLGWKWALRIVGFIIMSMLIVGNLTTRGRLPPRLGGGTVDLKCFKDARFSWATVGIALFEFVLFAAIGLLPTFALFQGFAARTSFNILAILNAGSAVGRILAGYVSDRIGHYNTMILTLAWSTLVCFGLWLPVGDRVVLFYVFAPLFGAGTGSIISMAPVCLGRLCRADQYGQYYGTSYSVVAFATLICIPVGGDLLPKIGAEGFVAFFGGILVVSLASFMIARWACLEYKWAWTARI